MQTNFIIFNLLKIVCKFIKTLLKHMKLIIKILFTNIFFSLNTLFVYSQSLSPERVAHIKECTFKITIEGSQSIGTGFFVGNDGTFFTCWHVIEPAIIRNPTTKSILGIRKIFIHLTSDEIFEVGICANIVNNNETNQEAVAYDFCILRPINPNNTIFPFLRVGRFNDLQEGQEVYTCGYPLGITQQFLSRGIVSTKYIDTSNKVISNNRIISMPRSQALLDITLNKGNSGGAIVKIGATLNDDEVVGIADFIINPIGGKAEALSDFLKSRSGGVFLSGIDTNLLFANIIQVLDNSSIGISGCVAINHVLDGLAKL